MVDAWLNIADAFPDPIFYQNTTSFKRYFARKTLLWKIEHLNWRLQST